MTNRNSSPVSSNQHDVHHELVSRVRHHASSAYQRPIASHSHAAFELSDARVRDHGGPVILDSGCGTAESTRKLAQSFPCHLVIGIDKSHVRLSRNRDQMRPENLHIVRANCIDFWRLACAARWPIERHYLLYPNPWPKAKHLNRRWHGHPVFRSLLALGGILELRSNWEIYVTEFAVALRALGFDCSGPSDYFPSDAISQFERKYRTSGHRLFQLTSCLRAS